MSVKTFDRVRPHGFYNKAGRFQLDKMFVYQFPWDPSRRVEIPVGFETNFASIPWFARWAISPIDPDIQIAAIVHDYLVQEFDLSIYHRPCIIIDSGLSEYYDYPKWKESASIMRRIMKSEDGQWNNDVSRFKRFLVYNSLIAYGWFRA